MEEGERVLVFVVYITLPSPESHLIVSYYEELCCASQFLNLKLLCL